MTDMQRLLQTACAGSQLRTFAVKMHRSCGLAHAPHYPRTPLTIGLCLRCTTGNLEALLADAPLPYTGASGRVSTSPPPGAMAGPRAAMPRDHA